MGFARAHYETQRIVRQEKNMLSIHCQGNKILNQQEVVLFAIGRVPQTTDLDATLAIHPTTAEELVTLK